jgi:3-O-methylgallate 3,4-dioxygenase
MAQLVAAIGTSHTPLLVTDAELWPMLAERDRTNPMLYDDRGVHRSYDELAAVAGGRWDGAVQPDHLAAQHRACQAALDRLAADLAAARPDVVVIIGDDQHELFDATNQPAIAIGWGEQLRTGRMGSPPSPLNDQIRTGYAMDHPTAFRGAPDVSLALIASLMGAGFDVASVEGRSAPAAQPDDPHDAGAGHRGFGHAYGFVINRLFGGRDLPVVPVLLNTFYPPNQPTPARCVELGRALAAAIAALPGSARVVVVASGGLSHFVVDEELDGIVVEALRRGDSQRLCSLPVNLLEAGSSEIRNWITMAGTIEGRPADWLDYHPVRRSPAGTGVGCGFASWSVG